jgi:hypothetical protein
MHSVYRAVKLIEGPSNAARFSSVDQAQNERRRRRRGGKGWLRLGRGCATADYEDGHVDTRRDS